MHTVLNKEQKKEIGDLHLPCWFLVCLEIVEILSVVSINQKLKNQYFNFLIFF